MKKLVCIVMFLILSQITVADYILISGSDTTTNSGRSITRYRDDFVVVWERSPALETPESTVFNGIVEISPLDPSYGGGDVYTGHYAPDRLVKHLDWETGDYIGRAVPSSTSPAQTDGTGQYTPPSNMVLQDMKFGPDYNGDGVADLWVARRDAFEV